MLMGLNTIWTTRITKMTIKRKIVGYGYSKLVCLPKYWIEQQNYKKGDLIDMEITQHGDLLLRKNEDNQTI